jgi:hypothetical protein
MEDKHVIPIPPEILAQAQSHIVRVRDDTRMPSCRHVIP